TSLRSVEWESFQPNFFVLASPGALDGYPASHITAVQVPPEQSRFTAELVQAFPNLSVIDVDAVLAQVRSTADQVSDRKSTRLNSSHVKISYAVFCLKKKKISK